MIVGRIDNSPKEIAGDPNKKVTPARVAIIKQTVEALLRACASHRASGSGESGVDASIVSDLGRASDTSEGGRGNSLF